MNAIISFSNPYYEIGMNLETWHQNDDDDDFNVQRHKKNILKNCSSTDGYRDECIPLPLYLYITFFIAYESWMRRKAKREIITIISLLWFCFTIYYIFSLSSFSLFFYYVCSYLVGNQLSGASSVEGYVDALKRGCRCVERKKKSYYNLLANISTRSSKCSNNKKRGNIRVRW